MTNTLMTITSPVVAINNAHARMLNAASLEEWTAAYKDYRRAGGPALTA